jgi:hypothetical protein
MGTEKSEIEMMGGRVYGSRVSIGILVNTTWRGRG